MECQRSLRGVLTGRDAGKARQLIETGRILTAGGRPVLGDDGIHRQGFGSFALPAKAAVLDNTEESGKSAR